MGIKWLFCGLTGECDGRSFVFDPDRSLLFGQLGVYRSLRKALRDSMEYLIALVVAIGVGVYLFAALLRPERF
jgi:K+-transporting ATPase KdpF subunit